MCHELLRDARFFALLMQFDRDLAEEVRKSGCPACGGPLHRAAYPRKPRGGPEDLGDDYDLRLSFCCANRDCRKRATPPSARFQGRRVYLGAAVVLISAMLHGATLPRLARLKELFGVSPKTVARWRSWWLDVFAEGSFWKAKRGSFIPPAGGERLPQSMLERFLGSDRERLSALLRFIAPITTATAGGVMAF